jgi:UBX domain-containing protein 1
MALYYANQDQEDDEDYHLSDDDTPTTGGRTLGGDGVPSRPVGQPAQSSEPTAASSATTRSAAAASGRMRTLQDLQSGAPGPSQGRGQGRQRSGADSDDDENDQDFFAGGEKSGLAVQNPNNPRSTDDRIRSIVERARQ